MNLEENTYKDYNTQIVKTNRQTNKNANIIVKKNNNKLTLKVREKKKVYFQRRHNQTDSWTVPYLLKKSNLIVKTLP